MRFLSFNKHGVETVGIRFENEVVDLSLAGPLLPSTLRGLIEGDYLEEAGALAEKAPASARRAVSSIEYLPLLPNPVKFFGMGTNYGSHIGARPKIPGFFLSQPERLCAHNAVMLVPRYASTLDYEAELALVLRKGGKHIPESEALDYVAGYTIFNDGSIRGLLVNETLAMQKNSDKTGAFGPELVTPDELPLGADGLAIKARRNGVEVQSDTTANMFWKVPEAIALLSSYMTLEAGTVITTGTCGGTIADRYILANNFDFDGMANPNLDYLRAGEVMECEIEGIGVLRNPIANEP